MFIISKHTYEDHTYLLANQAEFPHLSLATQPLKRAPTRVNEIWWLSNRFCQLQSLHPKHCLLQLLLHLTWGFFLPSSKKRLHLHHWGTLRPIEPRYNRIFTWKWNLANLYNKSGEYSFLLRFPLPFRCIFHIDQRCQSVSSKKYCFK